MVKDDITQEQEEKAVLTHLNALKTFYGEDFDKLIIYGEKATAMVKLLADPDAFAKRWNALYAFQLYRAIDTIYEKNIIPFPKIPRRTDKERILLNLLLMYGEGILGRDPYFEYGVKLHHVLAYLQRDKVIYTWEPSAVLAVKGACYKGIQELLYPSERRLAQPKQAGWSYRIW